MSPAREWPSLCPVRTFWKVVISGISRAAVGGWLAILWREQRVQYSIRLPVLLVMTCRNFG